MGLPATASAKIFVLMHGEASYHIGRVLSVHWRMGNGTDSKTSTADVLKIDIEKSRD